MFKARCYAGEEDSHGYGHFQGADPSKAGVPVRESGPALTATGESYPLVVPLHAPETSSRVPKYRIHRDNCRSFSRERLEAVSWNHGTTNVPGCRVDSYTQRQR